MNDLKRLSVDTLDDFLDYFDHRAFVDNAEWSGCYCQFYLGTPDEDIPLDQKKEQNRALACSRVETGEMDGYLLYSGDKVIAWCAAGNSMLYLDFPDATDKLARILCFNVEPNLRGQGIATELLDLVIADLAERGFEAVEAAPVTEVAEGRIPYRGTLSMFVKIGFEKVMELSGNHTLVRRYLS
jgi:ribosomal protein S18 acetylase RimI-like enzyme